MLPFRVTTADSLLGEGLAELIAAEFTGESGPRAVHMGSVLRAWRRAGGGLRAPLSQSDGMRVAREVGAGLLIEGSVVGLGSRLRVTASVVSVPDGAVRSAEPVSGAVDSLEPLLRRLTTGLLGVVGGRARARGETQLTDSPQAMRAYLEGLSLWRRSRYPEAAAALERAFAADSVFAQAAFMRYRIGSWMLQTAANAPWASRAQALRDRLSPEDRLLLLDYFGEPGAPPSRGQRLADRRRVASLLPESPDAQYLYGDLLWHWGAAGGEADWLELARVHFERALALDSLSPILQHLLEVGLLTNDTALVRHVWPAFDRLSDAPGDWGWAWIVGGRTNDAALLAALRRRAQEPTSPPVMSARAGLYGVSAALTDEMYALAMRHGASGERAVAPRNYFVSATVQGRPAAAARTAVGWTDSTRRDALTVLTSLFADGDSAAGAAAARGLAASPPADSAGLAVATCALAHWRLRAGTSDADDEPALRRLGQVNCADALALERAGRAGAADLDARLATADSAIRAQAPIVGIGGFEHIVLARLWEARGNLPRALEAIRARSYFQGLEWTAATCARMEGRLAAAVSDTTRAILAFRHYLMMRQDAEPVLIPQRDSVRAEVARLERRP